MSETKFIAKNEERWQQLEAFNQTLQRKGIRALSQMEIRAFAETFRAVGYHLAYAKTHFPNGTSVPYLTHIVGVAHNYYYVREQGSFSTVKEYFLHSFPQSVRAVWRYAAVAAILFFIGMFFAYAYVGNNIQRFEQIFPFELNGGYFDLGEGEVIWDYPLMSAVIMTNNIRVSIMALAFGITAGIGTAWILFYNGMIVGALASFVAATGGPRNTLVFWALILPHGVPELAAIFISGACGLMIGRAVIMPGSYRRKDAIIKEAKKAVLLMPGIATILVIAGLIEGFFTPMGVPPYFKLGFAFLTFVGLYLYFTKQ